jgi:hypothetical protein
MVSKKKRVVRKKEPVKVKSSVGPKKAFFSKFKLGEVFRNLVMFVLLFAISYILSLVSGGVFVDVFYFLWIIFACISLAFFIVLLVLLFLKLIKK